MTAFLWLAAAALAFAAAVVTYTRSGEIKVTMLAAALFLATMGFGVLRGGLTSSRCFRRSTR